MKSMRKWISWLLCAISLIGILAGCAGGTAWSGSSDAEASIGVSLAEIEKKPSSDSHTGYRKVRIPRVGELPVRRLILIKDWFRNGGVDRPVTEPVVNPVVSAGSSYERAKLVFIQLDKSDKNVLYSPVSLEMALGLLSEGAKGTTKEQICAFLGGSYTETAKSVMEMAESCSTDNTYFGYKTALNIANSLWLKKGYTLQSEYAGVASDVYDATAEFVDFSNPFSASARINDWCEEKTEGLIKEIISPEAITDDLAMILCNSLYFESAWYDSWSERAGTFKVADGSIKELSDMLYSTEKTYYSCDNAVAFGKRYVNGTTFVGILPNESVGIADIDLDALLASKTYEYDVRCSMPKLDYEFTVEGLVDVLKSIGVVDMFSHDADLSGLINEDKDLSVTDIIQKCKIELDEDGTKAAAVTAMMVATNAAVPVQREIKEVHLNRPFYYMIISEDFEHVLFIGRVNTI